MPSRNEIQKEIKNEIENILKNNTAGFVKNPDPEQQKRIKTKAPLLAANNIRKKYLKQLSELTGRNIIIYYSGFLRVHENMIELAVEDNDINGFMSAIQKIDKTIGVDLVLHTPGGSISAAEAIVEYLKAVFGINIRTVVPQCAFSAGTMIACCGQEILMGKHSSLGPTDPQFRGVPAHGIIEEFETAMSEVLKNEKTILIWREILSKYHPTFIGECNKAIELSNELAANWLENGMFAKDADRKTKSKNLVKTHLNNHGDSKIHDRHFNAEKCKSFGLKIKEIESDDKLQDAILSLHHATLISLDIANAVKIIESQVNGPWIVRINKSQPDV